MNKKFENIAVLQTAFLGDVALAMPLIEALKGIFPDSKITFITTKAASPIVEVVKSIDNVLVFDKRNKHKGIKGAFQLGRHLRDMNFDLFISLHRSFRSTIIAKIANAKTTLVFNNAALSFLFKKKCKYLLHEHEIRRNLNFLKNIDRSDLIEKFDKAHVQLTFSVQNIIEVDDFLSRYRISNQNIALIAPSSVWETKRWTIEGYVGVAKRLKNSGFMVCIIGSKSEKTYCDMIATKSGAINTSGHFTIPQTINLMTKSSILISNDSAPVHFAGLVNCPVVSIFGPTSPVFGFYPRSDNSIVIERAELRCKPCEIHGSKKCPIGTFDCMNLVTQEEVFEKAMMIISNSPKA